MGGGYFGFLKNKLRTSIEEEHLQNIKRQQNFWTSFSVTKKAELQIVCFKLPFDCTTFLNCNNIITFVCGSTRIWFPACISSSFPYRFAALHQSFSVNERMKTDTSKPVCRNDRIIARGEEVDIMSEDIAYASENHQVWILQLSASIKLLVIRN